MPGSNKKKKNKSKPIVEVVSGYFTRSRGNFSTSDESFSPEDRSFEASGSSEHDDKTILLDNKTVLSFDSKMEGQVKDLQYRDLLTYINPFDGSKKKYKYFVAECERALKRAGNNSQLKEYLLDVIVTRVSGLGCSFANTHSLNSWQQIKDILDSKFGDNLSEADILHKLTSVKQGNRSVFDFYEEVTDLIAEYEDVISRDNKPDDVNYKSAMSRVKLIAMKSFQNGLNPEINRALLYQDPQSLKEVYELARKFETNEKLKVDNDDAKLARTLKDLLKLADNPSNFNSPKIKKTNVIQCQLCGKNHSAVDCYRNKSNVVCQLCNRKGHTAIECRSSGNRNYSGNRNFNTHPGNNRNNYQNRSDNSNAQYNNPNSNRNRSNYQGNNYNPNYSNNPSNQQPRQ